MLSHTLPILNTQYRWSESKCHNSRICRHYYSNDNYDHYDYHWYCLLNCTIDWIKGSLCGAVVILVTTVTIYIYVCVHVGGQPRATMTCMHALQIDKVYMHYLMHAHTCVHMYIDINFIYNTHYDVHAHTICVCTCTRAHSVYLRTHIHREYHTYIYTAIAKLQLASKYIVPMCLSYSYRLIVLMTIIDVQT